MTDGTVCFPTRQYAKQRFAAVGTLFIDRKALMAVAAHQFVGRVDGHVGRQRLRASVAHDVAHGDGRSAMRADQISDAITHGGRRVEIVNRRGGRSTVSAAAQIAHHRPDIDLVGAAACDHLDHVIQIDDQEECAGIVKIAQTRGQRARSRR